MGSFETIEKAYDRLEWHYIRKCLEYMEFHSIWINWIVECITSVSYSIMVNDEPNRLIGLPGELDQETLYPHIYSFYVWKR